MRAIRAFSLAVMLAGFTAIDSTAQVPADLQAAMQARDSSIYAQDAVTFARYTADEFTVVLNDGTIKTKATRLAEMRKAKPAPFEPFAEQEIHMYGNVGIRRSLWVKGTLRVTEIWVKGANGWQVVAIQMTTIKK